MRIYNVIKDEPLFRRHCNATGRPQAHPLQKVVAALRALRNRAAADRANKYVRFSKCTINITVKSFIMFIVTSRRTCAPRRTRKHLHPGVQQGTGLSRLYWQPELQSLGVEWLLEVGGRPVQGQVRRRDDSS